MVSGFGTISSFASMWRMVVVAVVLLATIYVRERKLVNHSISSLLYAVLYYHHHFML